MHPSHLCRRLRPEYPEHLEYQVRLEYPGHPEYLGHPEHRSHLRLLHQWGLQDPCHQLRRCRPSGQEYLRLHPLRPLRLSRQLRRWRLSDPEYLRLHPLRPLRLSRLLRLSRQVRLQVPRDLYLQ